MVFVHHYDLKDLDEEELRDLLDETDDPELTAKVEKELQRRIEEGQVLTRTTRPALYVLLGLVALATLLIVLVIRQG